ncbi:MAG: hypothetical protein JWP08_1132, partial [Bryobacterales bacterium]|nr:hypothetical protein [Bryobacterales bacterium]
MLTRLSLLISFLSVSAASIYGTAMVTCSQPGFSETVYNGSCSVVAGVNNTFSYEAYTRASISG